MHSIEAGSLAVAYDETGPAGGTPVLLLHGFPYDVAAYREVAKLLSMSGCRCIVPYLRGYGPTRFRAASTMRSGQQAALGQDVLALMDALDLRSAVLAGYDWGGRAACVVAALWPERVRGLVTAQGYNIQDIATGGEPKSPEQEHRLWYQYYFHSERGRRGLAADPAAFCRLLWRLWSPSWRFTDAEFADTAAAFSNPDFVEIVVHSYRHRFGYAQGDPTLEAIEARLAQHPAIVVPSVALHGMDDGVSSGISGAERFTGWYREDLLPGIGHAIPQEAPERFAQAVLAVMAAT